MGWNMAVGSGGGRQAVRGLVFPELLGRKYGDTRPVQVILGGSDRLAGKGYGADTGSIICWGKHDLR